MAEIWRAVNNRGAKSAFGAVECAKGVSGPMLKAFDEDPEGDRGNKPVTSSRASV